MITFMAIVLSCIHFWSNSRLSSIVVCDVGFELYARCLFPVMGIDNLEVI